jgi:uncharacterized protein (DUF2141 family)
VKKKGASFAFLGILGILFTNSCGPKTLELVDKIEFKKEKGNRKGEDPSVPVVVANDVQPTSAATPGSLPLEKSGNKEVTNETEPTPAPTQVTSSVSLEVNITGLKNTSGLLCYSMFSGPDGFPDDANRVVSAKCFEISEKSFTFTLEQLKPGSYALAFHHDENRNGKMDKNILGIPKEEIGFSNNAKIRLDPPGPPKYEDAKIEVTSELVNRIQVEMVNLLD